MIPKVIPKRVFKRHASRSVPRVLWYTYFGDEFDNSPSSTHKHHFLLDQRRLCLPVNRDKVQPKSVVVPEARIKNIKPGIRDANLAGRKSIIESPSP